VEKKEKNKLAERNEEMKEGQTCRGIGGGDHVGMSRKWHIGLPEPCLRAGKQMGFS